MAIHYFNVRVADLQRVFIAMGGQASKEKQQPGKGDNRATGYNKAGVNSDNGVRKKQKYIRSDTLKVKVFAYQNPEPLQRVDQSATWYQEHKVVETGQYWVIVLVNGYRVKYSVQVYTFKGVPNNDAKVQELFNHLRKNPKRIYSGWLHHANLYFQVSKQFHKQVPLNYFL